MAINFGDTIMEGGIEPAARVQAPVQDDSGAILAEGFGSVARNVGAIAGSIFLQQQEDETAKVLSGYENDLLDLADAVDQGSMDRNEAMIRARALRRQYLANAPALREDFDSVWTSFAKESGLGHVVVEGTIEQQAMEARTQEAIKLGYTPEQYDLFQARARQATALNQELDMLKARGGIVTQTMQNQGLQAVVGLADAAFPAAQSQINRAMAEIEANPSNRTAIIENLNTTIGMSIAQLDAMGGSADTAFITDPIKNLMDTFNKWANNEIETESLTAAVEYTQAQYSAMYATDSVLGPVIAQSKLLNDLGLANTSFQTRMFDVDVLTRLEEVRKKGVVNILGNDDASAKFTQIVTEAATISLSEEGAAELKKAYDAIIDGTYVNERSANGALGFKDTVEALGSPAATEFFKQHGAPEARHIDKFADVIRSNYEAELVPAIQRYWESVPISDPTRIGATGAEGNVAGIQNIPMSQLLEPVWNGNAVEFVPRQEWANNPRIAALAQEVNTGNSSIGVPLNNLIRAYANVTQMDAKQVWETQFANRLFGLGEEGGEGASPLPADEEEITPSVVPEEDSSLDLSDFQPSEVEFTNSLSATVLPAYAESFTSGEFVDPKSNPEVSPQVLAKFGNRRLPVSIRNNNMGAVSITGSIENSWAAKQPGFIGTSPRPANEGGYYAKYATPEHGVGAASRLLEMYGRGGTDTAAAIVRKWSVDRSAHNAYANTLVRYLNEAGYNVNTNTRLDLSDPNVRMAILKAKSAHESGAGVPIYSDAVFQRGVTYSFQGAS